MPTNDMFLLWSDREFFLQSCMQHCIVFTRVKLEKVATCVKLSASHYHLIGFECVNMVLINLTRKFGCI